MCFVEGWPHRFSHRSTHATEGDILGLVHHTHPASPEFLQNTVVRDDFADHGVDVGTQGCHVRCVAEAKSTESTQRSPQACLVARTNYGGRCEGIAIPPCSLLIAIPVRASERASRHGLCRCAQGVRPKPPLEERPVKVNPTPRLLVRHVLPRNLPFASESRRPWRSDRKG